MLDGESVLAFDTGPASCLLDAAAQRRTGEPCDRDGRLALAGRVDELLLARLLAEPYYAQGRTPKSDRPRAVHHRVRGRTGRPLTPISLATLTELTAVTVADACRPYGVTEVVASGGGMRNPALLAARCATGWPPRHWSPPTTPACPPTPRRPTS